MPQEVPEEALLLLVMSVLIVLSMLLKTGARRFLKIPPVVGYIALGVALRAAQQQWPFWGPSGAASLDFLAQFGVAALLFQVGLTSNVGGLLAQLPTALRVWAADVLVSVTLAFGFGLAVGLTPLAASFVAAALSATSVGISVAVWEEAKRLKSRLGQLLVDVAELDDLSAILLLLVVMAVAPGLQDGGSVTEMATTAVTELLLLLLKLALFSGACWLFSSRFEQRFTSWLDRAEHPPDRLLSIVGVGFGIAALAGVLGFSVAVGALFAGLLFSRDPKAVREQASFRPLYAFFTPFFFIDVGYALDTSVIGQSLLLGLGLFVPAALGKFLGVGAPVTRRFGLRAGVLLGVSMIPRAEIALLVAKTGNSLGPWAVTDTLYGAIVCAAGLASIASPLVLAPLLQRWPEITADEQDTPSRASVHI